MRQKIEEIRSTYVDDNFILKFKKLFSLSLFFRRCIIGPNYNIPLSLRPTIVLSGYGIRIFEKLKKEKFNSTDEYLITFALFVEFYHEDLLIDVINTDISAVESLLNKQIIDSSIIFPWIYGR